MAKAPATVIINGVDLQTYTPDGAHERPTDRFRLLLLEGSLAGGLNSGLFHAVALAEKLSAKFPMEVVVAGKVDDATQRRLQSKVPVKFLAPFRANRSQLWRAQVTLMYSAEVNPPCPNSVIEALACGLPVIGFDSGSLKELVTDDAGCIVPYGGNPWKLETPDISALAVSAENVLMKQDQFRAAARKRAESAFGLDQMVDVVSQSLVGGLSHGSRNSRVPVEAFARAFRSNNIPAYHETTAEDLTLYEWWVTPHRLDGLPFHEFMMTSNASRGSVFGAEDKGRKRKAVLICRICISNAMAIRRLQVTRCSSAPLLPEGVKVAAHNESRVMVKLDGAWKVVHVHKSPAYSAPHVHRA